MMGAVLGVGVLVFAAIMAVGFAILGAPNDHIEFYRDGEIVCWWNNLDGHSQCDSLATGKMTCQWDELGTFNAATPSDIQPGCWPSAHGAKGDKHE